MKQLNKKADITFSEIVYAALALVILVVLVMIFTGQFGELGKRFNRAGNPTESAATKVGWCLDTLTFGKQCEYGLSCSDIMTRVGGSGISGQWDETMPPKTTECNQAGQVKTFSTSEKKFCCIKV